MVMLKIKRDDEVVVVAGKDKGKRGKVLKVLENNKVLVSGVQMIKKHQKPNPNAGIPGGIIEKESPIQVSNLARLSQDFPIHRVLNAPLNQNRNGLIHFVANNATS